MPDDLEITRDVDFHQHKLKRPVLEKLTGAPVDAVEGEFWLEDEGPQYFDGINPRPLGGGGASLNYRGPYSGAATYNTNDVVNDVSGNSWVATQDGFTAQSPAEGAYWTLLAARGMPGIDGINSFTLLAATFTQPAVGGNVTVEVGNSEWIGVSQLLFLPVGGYYQVLAVPDVTHVQLVNQGYPENAAPGASVSSPKLLSPAGARGTQGGQGDPGGVKYATLVKFGV